jgi:tetratricopeptide (TPR) repeat protein
MQGSAELAIESSWQMANQMRMNGTPRGRMQKRLAAPWMTLKIFGRWDEVLAIDTPEYSTPYLDGILAYVKGSAFVAKGQMAQAETNLETIRALAASPEVVKNQAGASPTAEILALAAHGLAGEIAYAKGDYLAAADSFEQGVAVEDTNNYTEPPDWPQSMRLYQGAALLKAGDYEKAEAVFRRDLQWHQNNGWSLYGLMRALEAQGKAEAASEIRKQWEPIWANADVELSAPVFL